MTVKRIDINPALFGAKSSSKTRKKRGGEKPNLSHMIAPSVNLVKNSLLKKIKEHKMKETRKIETEQKKNAVVAQPHLIDESSMYDDFNDSMAYLTTLSQQKKVSDEKINYENNRQKKIDRLQNKTLRRYDSVDMPPVHLEMPDNLKEPLVNITTDVRSLNVVDAPIKLVKDPIPYSNLKHGNKPTYREWTRRNTDQIQPVVISGENLTNQQSEREKQMNLIKAKLKLKQEQTKQNSINTNHLNTNINKMGDVLPRALITAVSNNIEQLKVHDDIVERIHHRTIRRKHIIGKLKKKRSVGILLTNRDTRKQILTACKELKRKPMVEVKQYLRDHNFIKIGSNAPNDVIRQMYESAVLSGEVRNNNVDVLMHNFIKSEGEGERGSENRSSSQ